MTEEEFNEKVKYIADHYFYSEEDGIDVPVKPPTKDAEHYKFAERLKKTTESQLTKEDLDECERLINKDFATGGLRRGEFNFLSAETSPEKSLLCVKDKWFFYRHHQFHNIHHKRRRAHFDEISLMLMRFNWARYKEELHKKKYHIFDKTPRAKAERLALKRSREKIKSTLMIS